MGNGSTRRLLIGAVVALGVVAVVAVLAAGPAEVGAPRWQPPEAGGGASPAPAPTAGSLATAAPDPTNGSAAAVVRIAAEVIFTALVLLALGVVVLHVIRALRGRRVLHVRPAAPAIIEVPMPVVQADGVAAPIVLRGIARALAILDEPREPADAVVQAWLGLEDAAVASGAGRRPAETPSEYVARIIRRFDTDRAAADTLLRLYEDVRFGARRVDASAVETARQCLVRLEASWHESADASRA